MTWNAGGWFGMLVGGTCWIAICSALLISHDVAVSGMVSAVFLSANVVGTLIWFSRDRVSAFIGIQTLLIVIGGAGLVAIFIIDRSGLWHIIQGVGGTVSALQMYMLLAVTMAGLFGLFWSLNRGHAEDGPVE